MSLSKERLAYIRRATEDGAISIGMQKDLLAEVDRQAEFIDMLLGIEKKIVRAPRYNEQGQRMIQDLPQA